MDILKEIKNPPKKYRPIPFWSWNDKLEVDETVRQIDEMEDKLIDLEDSYYKKFAAMETALSKLNTQTSYLTNMFGGTTA